jgi:hypothetical protein
VDEGALSEVGLSAVTDISSDFAGLAVRSFPGPAWHAAVP